MTTGEHSPDRGNREGQGFEVGTCLCLEKQQFRVQCVWMSKGVSGRRV